MNLENEELELLATALNNDEDISSYIKAEKGQRKLVLLHKIAEHLEQQEQQEAKKNDKVIGRK